MTEVLQCDLTKENKRFGLAKVNGPSKGRQNVKVWFSARIGDDSDGRDIGGGMFSSRRDAQNYADAYNAAQFAVRTDPK